MSGRRQPPTVTEWVEDPVGGRARGPTALLRTWVEVLVRPRRFFRTGVAPGDQAAGFVFAVAIAFVAATLHFAFVPDAIPDVGSPALSFVLGVGAVALLLAPTVLHLLAALQTLLLVPFVDDRGGVSETVQVLAYATAPCALAGLPVPEVRLVCGGYGAVLLATGVAERHGVSAPAAILLTLPSSALLFGYVFRAFPA